MKKNEKRAKKEGKNKESRGKKDEGKTNDRRRKGVGKNKRYFLALDAWTFGRRTSRIST